jgi:hypothetical protein
MQTGQAQTYRDGSFKWHMIVPLQVQPSQLFTDGRAAWYVKGQAKDELARAMAEAQAPPDEHGNLVPESGAWIQIEFTGYRQVPGMNAAKQYAIVYRRPDATASGQHPASKQSYPQQPVNGQPQYQQQYQVPPPDQGQPQYQQQYQAPPPDQGQPQYQQQYQVPPPDQGQPQYQPQYQAPPPDQGQPQYQQQYQAPPPDQGQPQYQQQYQVPPPDQGQPQYQQQYQADANTAPQQPSYQGQPGLQGNPGQYVSPGAQVAMATQAGMAAAAAHQGLPPGSPQGLPPGSPQGYAAAQQYPQDPPGGPGQMSARREALMNRLLTQQGAQQGAPPQQ